MKINKLLIAAVVAIAVGTLIAGLIGDLKGQSMTSAGARVPFLHGWRIAQIFSRDELAFS